MPTVTSRFVATLFLPKVKGGQDDLVSRGSILDYLDEIHKLKSQWGEAVIILGHHYQRPEIADLSDCLGDSYELSKVAADAEAARYIVFCGVRFMAEAAEILRRPEQRVIHPEMLAGCPMADMATVEQAEVAWHELVRLRGVEAVMPLV